MSPSDEGDPQLAVWLLDGNDESLLSEKCREEAPSKLGSFAFSEP